MLPQLPKGCSDAAATSEGYIPRLDRRGSNTVMRGWDSEEKRRPTVGFAGLGEVTADPNTGRLLRANTKMCEITGYPEEELLGLTLFEIMHRDDREKVSERFRRTVCGEGTPEEYTYETRYARKDGGVAWASVTARANRDGTGQVSCVVLIFRDLTDRKKAEEVLRQQADLLEQTHDAVFMWKLGGGITYWNRGAERLYGWSKEDATGRVSHELLDTIHPIPTKEFDLKLRMEGQWEGELVQHTRDGRQVVVESRHVLTRYEAGSGFVMETNQDITERKEAEEALKEIRENERRRIARDLHDEALQDLVYALEEMRVVRAKPESGTRLEAPELEAGLGRAIEALERATLGLHGAIYDLRLQAEREQSFVEMLGSLVEQNHRNWSGCEIEFRVEGYSSPPLSETAQVELLRIVQEALTNVRRHSRARHVRVALSSAGDSLWVEVSDDGRGFVPGMLAGTGITGMRERAHALNGDLTIASEPGKAGEAGGGTKVRFEMALERGGEEPQREEKEARILLVEDHTSFRQAVASVFEGEPGFTVVGQAQTLSEARGMLDGGMLGGVDVAIVDLTLMDGHGGDLIRDLRAADPDTIALVLTASPDRAEAARAVEAGAAGVLHKSVGMDQVVDAVRRLRAGESLLSLEEVMELMRLAGTRREQEHEARQAIARLTTREKEVLRALAEGLDGKEIAERLHISNKTERNHMANILIKLGVHSRLQALVFALRHGMVDVR